MAERERDTFAGIVQAARREGLTRHLPTIARVGATGLNNLTAHATRLAQHGVPADDILRLIQSRPPEPRPTEGGPSRADLPVRRYAPRASMQAAIEAAQPNNRKRALTDLEDGVLAASTRGPMESRRRSWQELCHAWGVQPWPITTDNLRAVAASLKAGHYQSAQLYFEAVWYQQQDSSSPT